MNRFIIICLLISIVFRIVLGFLQRDIWKIKFYKYFIFIPIMTILGVLGAKISSLMAFDSFSGNRLYGTVIMVAITVPIIAITMLIPVKDLYGFSSLGTWASIAIMKISCIEEGCCFGRKITLPNLGEVQIPSQILESLVAFAFFVWFYYLVKKKYFKAGFYPLLMIWYGIYRYLFDWLRGNIREQRGWFLWIPAGRFFSLIIFFAGIISMLYVLKKEYGVDYDKNKFFKAILGKEKGGW